MKKKESSSSAIDRHLGTYDVRSSHAIEVGAAPTATYRAARELDLGRSLPVIALFAMRSVPHVLTGKARPSRSFTIETALDAGFTILEERPPTEFVMGAVGKFWRPDSGFIRIASEEFQSFDEPGYAKAVLAFTVEEREPGSFVTTETRVACTDTSALRKFSLYWRVIGPFSGFIRRIMLEEIKRSAEKAGSTVLA